MIHNRQTIETNLHKRAKGNIGEYAACKYLERKGFRVIARNYQKAWGEIDIICLKDTIVHFIEVKSVIAGPHHSDARHRPEDNVHGLKVRHIRRMVETFLQETGMGLDAEFEFHIACVYLDFRTRKARVRLIENVIL